MGLMLRHRTQPKALVRYAARFAAGGGLLLGLVGLLYAMWDRHRFAVSFPGQVPVDDTILMSLAVACLGLIIGGGLGAVFGLLIGFARSPGVNDRDIPHN